jgi:protein kinase N
MLVGEFLFLDHKEEVFDWIINEEVKFLKFLPAESITIMKHAWSLFYFSCIILLNLSIYLKLLRKDVAHRLGATEHDAIDVKRQWFFKGSFYWIIYY